METVAEHYGDQPRITLAPVEQWPQPQPSTVWANYDQETDSMIVYLTGKPVRGIHVWLQDGVYVIVDPATEKVVGMQVEAWEKSFVPAHEEIRKMWSELRPVFARDVGWSYLLRAIALWLVMLLRPEADGPHQALRPT
jgi:hypothetical protein